jgi:hypothetical protein
MLTLGVKIVEELTQLIVKAFFSAVFNNINCKKIFKDNLHVIYNACIIAFSNRN